MLDKTGTLTEGKPVVTDVLPASGVLRNPFLRAAASLESLSEHPLAEAIVLYAKGMEIEPDAAQNLRACRTGHRSRCFRQKNIRRQPENDAGTRH